ncbi:MAG: Cache 3/Cache 2 fusion domain-containing protein, partial [Pseudothermotoga sp.]
MKASLRFYGILLVLVIVLIAVIPLIFVATNQNQRVASSISNQMYENMLNGALEVLKEYVKYEYGTLRLQNSQLVDKDGKAIKDRFEVVDKISKQMNVVATIFQAQNDDFIKIATSIRKDDGTRAVGTYLGKDSAAYRPIVQKQRYLGQAKILGKDYATGYDPIVDENNNVIGILFVGVPQQTINTLVSRAKSDFVRNTLIVTAVLIGIAIIIGMVFVNVVLIKPFFGISKAIAKVAEGDLSYKITSKFISKEFTNLAKAVEKMTGNLSAMILDISRSSEKLSSSSEILSSTSQELNANSEELYSQMEEVNKSAQNASAS